MTLLFFLSIIAGLITIFLIYKISCFCKNLFHLEHINTNSYSIHSHKKPKILLVCTVESKEGFGGEEIHVLNLYKNLLKHQNNTIILVVKNTQLQKKLTQLKLPHYACKNFKIRIFGISLKPGYSHLRYICKKEKINIIHCNEEKEILLAKQIAKKLPIKTIFTRHIENKLRKNTLYNIDGLIGVGKQIISHIKKKACKKNYNIKEITYISPICDQKKFELCKPEKSKYEFFKKNFGLSIKNLPIICTIANMYKDGVKNHILLFKAIYKLVYQKNKKVQLILAGTGPSQESLKNKVKTLKLTQYIYFLGRTNKIPEVLFYSDMKVLPSLHEGFSMVLTEASLMKKPIIAPTQTGAINIIKHNKTGLLFKNNDVDDLINQIEHILNNYKLGQTLGIQAYNFVKTNFSIEENIKNHILLYNKIVSYKN